MSICRQRSLQKGIVVDSCGSKAFLQMGHCMAHVGWAPLTKDITSRIIGGPCPPYNSFLVCFFGESFLVSLDLVSDFADLSFLSPAAEAASPVGLSFSAADL